MVERRIALEVITPSACMLFAITKLADGQGAFEHIFVSGFVETIVQKMYFLQKEAHQNDQKHRNSCVQGKCEILHVSECLQFLMVLSGFLREQRIIPDERDKSFGAAGSIFPFPPN